MKKKPVCIKTKLENERRAKEEQRKEMLNKSRNELINLINNPNYTEAFKLEKLDELVNAFKFQTEKAIAEGLVE